MSNFMDIQRLKTLRELAVRGTMAAVSEILRISPSAVSQQISLLEEEVGAALVERRGRGVSITPAGNVLVQHAERILAVMEEAKTDLAAIRAQVAGQLSIASFPSIGASLLPPAIRQMQLEYPALVVSAIELEPLAALAALRSWQCDIAVVDDITLKQSKDAPNLETFPIYQDQLVAIVRRDHALAQKRAISIYDLKDECWAIDTRPNTFSDALLAMCNEKGFQPRIVARFDETDVTWAMVAHGCAIAVVPQIRTLVNHSGLAAVPLSPPLGRGILLAIRNGENRRPSVKTMIESLKHHARHLPRADQ
ncbi:MULTISPECIES: LysR substrate-binding domain-containing protein [unclassified Mesorhizobium]|uniref:LysR family transcriptional regulator n=1 Tax=unclassified Mesorhizobium TaxID=325217 RepID=UPI00241546EB|nr:MULTISPECIES: LysR substrate-binding domain-containing protein [unclassified Mesorhizobium]MDG4889900.1 LysR substrate-binding domain-containing protein [Mesorhizobium sp. WSM4887]MDG4904043.1 LysR substrate-binding domain-containing protein [Mesorhizobium sp. WSM4962]MDG4909070.1 LysR substrate-binding domain-containing protein [Mesorhizobium sp. WSM4898]MDG4921694.1 LysR substrate-binding domain-containing protein [Mesorhizobium sp. WSM4989]